MPDCEQVVAEEVVTMNEVRNYLQGRQRLMDKIFQSVEQKRVLLQSITLLAMVLQLLAVPLGGADSQDTAHPCVAHRKRAVRANLR